MVLRPYDDTRLSVLMGGIMRHSGCLFFRTHGIQSMSNQSQDPFGANPNSPQHTSAQQGAPYQAVAGPPAKKSKGPLFWVLGCLGAMVLMGLVCCGGMVGVTHFGMTQVAQQIQTQVEDDAVIVEQIGEIESLSMSWSETMANAQNQGGNAGEMAFEITGSKGAGTLYITNGQAGGDGPVTEARLVTSDGQSHSLELDGASLDTPQDEAPFDLNDFKEITEPSP